MSTFPLQTGNLGINVQLPSLTSWLTSMFNPDGSLKVQLTSIYNDAEVRLKQNRDAYLSGSANVVRQREALTFFDGVQRQLYDASARTQQGLTSYQERFSGASSRWDWIAQFREPIANDPRIGALQGGVGDVIGGAQDALGTLTGTSFGTWATIGIIVVLGFIGWKMIK